MRTTSESGYLQEHVYRSNLIGQDDMRIRLFHTVLLSNSFLYVIFLGVCPILDGSCSLHISTQHSLSKPVTVSFDNARYGSIRNPFSSNTVTPTFRFQHSFEECIKGNLEHPSAELSKNYVVCALFSCLLKCMS